MSGKVCQVCGGRKAVGTYRYTEGMLTLCYDCRAVRSERKKRECAARRVNLSSKFLHGVISERGGKCERCGSAENLEVHHKIRLIDGGSNHKSNLLVLCSYCHHATAHRGWQA